MNKRKKHSCISWNGEIDLGNILTIVTIIIAIIALSYQRTDLKTKINDLDAVVRELEEEKFQREIQGLKQSEELNKHFSYTLDHTTDRFRDVNSQNDNEFIFILSELNEIIELLIEKNDLNLPEKEKLRLLKYRNHYKRLIYSFGRKYSSEIVLFEETNEPKEENFENINEYISAMKQYTDTLEKHTNMLLQQLEKSIEQPAKEVISAEEKYWNNQ